MASDTTKLVLGQQYLSLPEGPVRTSIAQDFLRIYGQTPEEYFLQNQITAPNISFIDPTQYNVGTGVVRTFGIGGTGTTPGQTGGGTPVGPTVTIPSTTQQGGFTNPTITAGGGTVSTSPVQPGTPGLVGGTTGGGGFIGTPGTPVLPPTTVGGGGTPDPCANATYRIGAIKELPTKSFPEYSGPEFVNLNKQCILIAEIYKCCANGETKLGWVELGRSKSSKFYENCPDGGKRPVVEQYYDMSNLGPSSTLILEKLDAGGNTVTISSKENLGWYNKRWTDSCLTSQLVSPTSTTSSPVFENFDDYFAFKFTSSIQVNGQTRQLFQNKLIYNETSSPSGQIISGFTSDCGQRGDCITVPQTGGPNTPTQGPYIDRNNRVEIPGTRKPTGTTEKRYVDTGVNDTLQKHPNKPCRLAIARLYDEVQIWEVQYGYPVYATPDFTGNIISYVPDGPLENYPVSNGRYTEYTNEQIDPNCGYREVINEYEEDDPSDKCYGIIKKDVTHIYEDGRIELYLKGAFVRYYRKQDADCSPETIKVYHPLDLGKDVISAKVRAKTKGLFGGSQTLECHHTSSTQPTASKTHYYEVTDCDSCGKTPYFAVAYGNNQGSGSLWAEGELNDTPTRAIYGQYRLLTLDLPETQFTFYTNGIPTASNDVYVINFSRTGMSDRIDPGNWELALAELRGGSYANSVFTGSNVAVSSSNKVMTFIDDSDDRSDTISCTHDPYVSYDIVSGSLNSGVYSNTPRHTYGIVYPNLGIIVLDPYKLNTELGFNTVSGSNIAGDNSFKLFTSISGSGVLGSYMKARNVKYKTTNHYFVRVAAPYGNFSNNPTYVSGSNGEFLHACFDKNPQTYITSIGLYNDFNELLAVAKLSRPINKTFDNDVLIKIRLNW
jgi:hypothetical protein